MAKTINTSLSSALLKFTFTDADGDVFASFKLNPADIRLVSRCEELAKFFDQIKDDTSKINTSEEMIKYNDLVEEKFNYLLGYDARGSLFGMMSATTILPDGDIFATKVLDKIIDAVGPEIAKRRQNMQAAVRKHTEKYKK